jgi:hypothetical protein
MEAWRVNISVQATLVCAFREFLSQVPSAPDRGGYASMKRLAMFLAFVLAATGCGQNNSRTPPPSSGHSIFDALLARESINARVKEVEQDLSGDTNKTIGQGGVRPQQWNDSRQGREQALARELLRDLQPSLKQMSVPDLLAAMKLYPAYSSAAPQGVAYWLCGEGNQMIIDELKSRPAAQLEPLKTLVRDKKSEVFLNESHSANLGTLCHEILKAKGVVVPDA